MSNNKEIIWPPETRCREDYKWWHIYSTRWGDNDFYGHINNRISIFVFKKHFIASSGDSTIGSESLKLVFKMSLKICLIK